MEMIGIVAAAIIAAAALLYQKAWERREKRSARYEAVMDALPGLTIKDLNRDKIDAIIAELHHPWLSAPPTVIKAFNAFLASVESGNETSDDDRENY